MNKMDKVRKAAEQFQKAVSEAFDNFTFASLTVYGGGMMYADTVLFENNEGIEAESKKRRVLYHQWNEEGEWKKEDSDISNEYNRACGLLLEEEVKTA